MNVLLYCWAFLYTSWSFESTHKSIVRRIVYPLLDLLTVTAISPDEFNRRLVNSPMSALVKGSLENA